MIACNFTETIQRALESFRWQRRRKIHLSHKRRFKNMVKIKLKLFGLRGVKWDETAMIRGTRARLTLNSNPLSLCLCLTLQSIDDILYIWIRTHYTCIYIYIYNIAVTNFEFIYIALSFN